MAIWRTANKATNTLQNGHMLLYTEATLDKYKGHNVYQDYPVRIQVSIFTL